ncbi:MAG: hypothetical protein A2233_02440 [Candidatus Kerfeldbacteria bacterium RIFOXYA2_FULL_38_24]|uniref:Cell division protein FtsL n=1 Tax=Candidatus Kerfeldbacteria bacterium RIFOXYB2_FULL_38_14 TaxID=1798547 RepID=A0A1G2BAV1_9BACT|nr:MAG: hypothetical protein A2233_02440 [Candidatus Kerfeldbacteria bacterium RIFOXYA2_FULL_38_24]OGY85846.1 MAG: hypothetical protein A2319_05830 [Candidatus Kerfeldbacteria bacterium RIFOXYB2_FULL_38_14]OGY89115.1 MAG: hypothetical protein A2458_02550 [Candidatus Kerfeldbacteria bacterium RIFOXYC2_FULL_38_9]
MKKRGQVFPWYLSVWQSRAFVFLLGLLFIFVAISLIKEVIRRQVTQREISALEQEVARLTQQNVEIGDIIALLQTSSHQDEEARTKLGLQKEGEHMVMLPNNSLPSQNGSLPDEFNQLELSTAPQKEVGNPQKWLEFFLNKYNNS